MVAGKERKARQRRSKPSEAQVFYGAALSEVEKESLPAARELGGLEDEIAFLRVRLRSMLAERPENLPLMLKGIELLVKALSANYRLSKESKADLSKSLRSALAEVKESLLGEAQHESDGDEGS